MSELRELAELCEAATGPDLRIDDAVYEALLDGERETVRFARYTASLDAAMQLVPDGCNWSVAAYEAASYDVCPRATINGLVSRAATPALALCAAALRAREEDRG